MSTFELAGTQFALSHNSMQIGLHQLLVQIHLVELIGVDDVHVVEAGDVLVTSKMPEQLDLPKSTLRQDTFGEDICDLLDGNRLARRIMCRCRYAAICALAELLGDGVGRVDEKRLLQDVVGGARRRLLVMMM